MRIGFRVGIFPKLSETFVLNQINFLMQRGHEVVMLADAPPDALENTLADDTRAARARTTYILPRSDLLKSAYNALPFRVRRAMEARQERRLIADCDAVVCNFGWFGARMEEASKGMGAAGKLATIFHGDDMSRHLSHGNENAYDELLKSGGLFLSVNRIWQERLSARGAPDHANLIHHLGVDPEKFSFIERQKQDGDRIILTTVCRIVEKKGLATALDALNQVRAKRPELDFEFRIYGDGPLRTSLKAKATALGLNDIIRFKGMIPNAKLRKVFADADVFLHPSVVAEDGDMEGLPIAMMEAMATGLPIVSTLHSGIPELVNHGVNGFLSPEGDVDHLTKQLIHVIEDHGIRAAMGRAARQTIETDFNINTSIDRLERLLYRLVEGDFRSAGAVTPKEAAE